MKLVLGSSSRFRQKILTDAGIAYEVIKPEIDEKKIRAGDHFHTPLLLSYAKAIAVANRVTAPSIVIACDQVVVCNDQILEKPEHPDQIRQWYKLYPKYPVQYVNGFTVFNTQTGASHSAQEISISSFREIPEYFMEEQIQKGVIFHCAGGIGDETEASYSTIVQGSRQSVIGMPIDFVMGMIERVK